MPTQEERLTALEQATAEHIKETAKHIRQTNENLTMTLGLIQRQSFDMSAINRRIDGIEEVLNIRFDATNAHLEFLQKQIDAVQTTLTQHTTLLNEHKALLTQILARLPEAP
jgi:hypothetical protein